MKDSSTKPILICDTQPVAIEGIRSLLDGSGDLRFSGGVCSMSAVLELTRTLEPAAVVIDKGFGTQPVMDFLQQLRDSGSSTCPVVWGNAMGESEALRLLQAGARGILRRTAEPEMLLVCLRSVTSGNRWMEECIFGNPDALIQRRQMALTAREREVAELVERGLRNRDIARSLGIQTGTVKIHLKHIFGKTGVRGRHGLALTGLRQKGDFPVTPHPG